MRCISKYTTNGIFSVILNFNHPAILMKPKNLQLLYISILKNKKASGHSHVLLTSVRACSSWLNSSWPGTHMLIRYGSMTPRGAHMRPLPSPLRAPLLLRKVVCNVHVALSNLTQHLFVCDLILYWHLVNTFTGIWSTSVQCADSKSPAEVKRLCECPGVWIAHLSWLNIMLAPIIKNLYVA